MDVTDDGDVASHQGSCRKYSGHSDPESGESVLPDLPAPDGGSEALSVQRGGSFNQVPGEVGSFIGRLDLGRHGPTMAATCVRCNCKIWNPEQHERWHRYAGT